MDRDIRLRRFKADSGYGMFIYSMVNAEPWTTEKLNDETDELIRQIMSVGVYPWMNDCE